METPNQIMARRVKEKFPHIDINPTIPDDYWNDLINKVKKAKELYEKGLKESNK